MANSELNALKRNIATLTVEQLERLAAKARDGKTSPIKIQGTGQIIKPSDLAAICEEILRDRRREAGARLPLYPSISGGLPFDGGGEGDINCNVKPVTDDDGRWG